MQFNFYKDDVFVKSVKADSLKEAESKAEIKIDAESGTSFTTGEIQETENTPLPDTPQKKTRKPRADKGTPRKTPPKEIKEITTRKRPEYFVFVSGMDLSKPMTHDEALKKIASFTDQVIPRIIQGHEIKVSKKISFHLK